LKVHAPRAIGRRAAILALLLAALAPLPSGAETITPYVTAKDIDLTRLIAPPPASGGSVEKAEIADIMEVQRTVSADRLKLAVADDTSTVFAMFGPLFGPKFAPAGLPGTTALFARAFATETFVVEPAKAYFNRARPYLVSKEIKPLVHMPASASYPSGHASRVALAAAILSAMVPELSRLLWARAEQYAESRIVVGMHYASDLDAGRNAGAALAAVLFTRPDFQADLAAARTELRAALGARP
jgi:acid phosphatase (class A)